MKYRETVIEETRDKLTSAIENFIEEIESILHLKGTGLESLCPLEYIEIIRHMDSYDQELMVMILKAVSPKETIVDLLES